MTGLWRVRQSVDAANRSSYRRKTFQRRIKRTADVVLAALLLLITAPVLALAMLSVRLSLGAPVLFTQKRAGYRGVIFTLYKLRTMRIAADHNGVPLPPSQRVTRVGRLLRRLSIDEIPQLWSVLRGEMSLIGPRPLLAKYLTRYSAAQFRRHDAVPGITGWAQVSGRTALSWDSKFAMDIWYVDNWSLWLDLRIAFKTIWTVLRAQGADPDGVQGDLEFLGSETTPGQLARSAPES